VLAKDCGVERVESWYLMGRVLVWEDEESEHGWW
jgi:hypothetical protein